MKSTRLSKLTTVVAGSRARWTYQSLRCRLSADARGVTVRMKGGNSSPGEPGDEFTFLKACASLSEALAFVDSLPSCFGPDEAQRLGFEQTGWALYD